MTFKRLSFFFFLIYLALGLFIFKDYGIHADDLTCQRIGVQNWNYILGNDRALFRSSDKHYGPAMELLIVGIQKLCGITDSRQIYLARHLIQFLVFYLSMIAFFTVARTLFGHEKWALAATLMLVLSPRIFCDSFFNTKDIAFLSFIIFSFYTLLRLIRRPTPVNLFVHCLACALAIDIRILGIVFIPLSLAVLLRELIVHHGLRMKYLLFLALYPLLMVVFVYVFWPILWEHPRYQFIAAFLESKRFPWGQTRLLYNGHFIPLHEVRLPWHYLPLWILITTPVLFTVFWLSGVFSLLRNFISYPVSFIKEKFIWCLVGFMGLAPVAIVIVLHSVVYNGWRHVFFIYPFFILISTYGFRSLFESLPGAAKKVVAAAVALYFMMLAGISAYFHPYENVYFNFPALAYFKPIESNFETEYWALSYRQGLEYLLGINPGEEPIKLSVANYVGFDNRLILTREERGRLDYMNTIAGASYYLSNNNYIQNENYLINDKGDTLRPLSRKIYEIKRLGIPIQTIYAADTGKQVFFQ